MELLLGLPAPAKLNLFLHVTGRRADGYHTLQTVFQLIELADWLDFERRGDGRIVREGDLLGPVEDDLVVRAARALQSATGARWGATLRVAKRIPAGSGMGGGSSDAATALIALNRLWDLGLSRAELAACALPLGADVPFFLHGSNAFAEGVGEQLQAVPTPAAWYAVVWPQVHVSTKEIFGDPGLTRNTKPTKMSDFSAAAGRFPQALFGANDLEAVARRRFPDIDLALQRLCRHGAARMTGSGSAVFVPTTSEDRASEALAECPSQWQRWAVRGLSEHPLAAW
ncbi:MAG: 4-(cytidine 5'-diphospho)-2-C-methyl-D-erythritol kinase [Burkholderiaceae bacterium]|jgi:4-diphosphocytidyl-2-C-methyl-D-erythritol kinase|nr:4-(cytidine 5'-diphospho)-2-C-methyl-D-erythritol kinase [Burkholderiaceae bacterium]